MEENGMINGCVDDKDVHGKTQQQPNIYLKQSNERYARTRQCQDDDQAQVPSAQQPLGKMLEGCQEMYEGDQASQKHVLHQRDTAWMEKSVKIRQNVVQMIESLMQSSPQEQEAVEQLDGTTEALGDEGVKKGGIMEKGHHSPVPFRESEDEEIVSDVGRVNPCFSFVSWTGTDGGVNAAGMKHEIPGSPDMVFKEEALDIEQSEHELEESENEMEESEQPIDEPDTDDFVVSGVLGDNMFTGGDVNMPPCVSQEEVIVNSADGDDGSLVTDSQETGEGTMELGGTFNNFKDAEVTVELNEEEVDILGTVSPVVEDQAHYSSGDESDGYYTNVATHHRQPLQQAMFHAMAPLPHSSRRNTTVPFTTHEIPNNTHVRGVKREYPDETPFQGAVRTKAARKITPPSPEKRDPHYDSPSSSVIVNKNLQENLRKQELDETFFTCDFCFKLFRRQNALMAHIKLHEALNIGSHNGHIYECKQCKKTYSSRYNLNHHTKRCHSEKDYKCRQCNEVYTTHADLSRHSKTHASKLYKCNRCGKVFQKRKTFTAHAKVHPQVVHECVTCFQKFSWEQELVDHNKVHQVPVTASVVISSPKETAPTESSSPNIAVHTSSSSPKVAVPKAGSSPLIAANNGHIDTQANNMKLDYCYSYINLVKKQFVDKPQVYQSFLNTIKEFKFKSIDINHFLERISVLFRDHPNLIDGFNTFLPEENRVDVPQLPPNKQALAVRDPLLDRQFNPRGELDDSLAYLGQVKARFSNKPIVYNTFTYIIKEYKLNSLEIPEVAARVMDLFKDHPDLILGFNTFLPPNSRINLPLYDSQQEQERIYNKPSPERSYTTSSSTDQNGTTLPSTEHSAIQQNGYEQQLLGEQTSADHEDSKALLDMSGFPRTLTLSNGHASNASNISVTHISDTGNSEKCANINVHCNSASVATDNEMDADEIKSNSHKPLLHTTSVETILGHVITEPVVTEKHIPTVDTFTEVRIVSKASDSYCDPISSENECANTNDSKDGATHVHTSGNMPTNSEIDDTCTQENITIIQGNSNVISSSTDSRTVPDANSSRNVPIINQEGIATLSKNDQHASHNNDEDTSKDITGNTVTGVTLIADTNLAQFITVSTSYPPATSVSTDIDRKSDQAIVIPNVVSAITSSPSTTCVNTKTGNSLPTDTLVDTSPTNSLLYRHLISRGNYGRRSSAGTIHSLATFTKINTPPPDTTNLDSNDSSHAGETSLIKINTLPSIRGSSQFNGGKLSVPFVVNSPDHTNKIFNMANTAGDTVMHGKADVLTITNPNFFTTGNNGAMSNLNCKALHTVAGNNISTGSSNVTLISTNTIQQSVTSTNPYTGFNIVKSTNVTQSTPSTYTLAATKGIASFPAVVPTVAGTNKPLLLIRTNPPSSSYYITNSGPRFLLSSDALSPGFLVPVTKSTTCNANGNIVASGTNAVSNLSTNVVVQYKPRLTSTTKKVAARKNNKPTKVVGQQMATLKTLISKNSIRPRPADPSDAMVNIAGVAEKNVINNTGIANACLKKRENVANMLGTVTNMNAQPKKYCVVINGGNKNRTLMPAGGDSNKTPVVVSLLPSAVGSFEEKISISEPKLMLVHGTNGSTIQTNSQMLRTYERGGKKTDETIIKPLLLPCTVAQNVNLKTKAARKQCLDVNTISTADEIKLTRPGCTGRGDGVDEAVLKCETCPKTYLRGESLAKHVARTHSS